MNIRPPQFGLKTIFAFVTWTAVISGLAASRLAGWTMTAVALSAGALNCGGRLQDWQRGAGQARLFNLGWALLALSLFLPAIKGCGDRGIPGWEAALICGTFVVDPPGESPSQWRGVLLYGWVTFGNLLLVGSPFLLRLSRQGEGRLHGGGKAYGVLLAMTVATMGGLSIRDNTRSFLVGYYIWCAAGLSLLCAYRIGWATLALMGIVVLLVWLA